MYKRLLYTQKTAMGKKENYKNLILSTFYFSGKQSCADISDSIGKSLPLTMSLLTQLIDEGYVSESGYAPSSGGRRPITYSLNADMIYIMSVAMDQLVTRITIMNGRNEFVIPVAKYELPLNNNTNALAQLAVYMEQTITQSGIDRKKIVGAGIGMPGFIDPEKGINYSFLNAGNALSITQFLQDRLKMPIYIDNDSSLIALAEYRFGSAKMHKNVMVVNIGWGVGLGMILNGSLFRGTNGFAGEFSHIPFFNNNKLCSCGKSGCLETETSLKAIIEKIAEALKTGRASLLNKHFPTGHEENDWQEIVAAALKGDKLAIEILSNTGYEFGRAVAILIHLLNPETVILSGRGALAGKVWQAPVQQALNEHCIPRLAANTSLGISTLGYDAELIGSAALVMENKLKGSHIHTGPEKPTRRHIKKTKSHK